MVVFKLFSPSSVVEVDQVVSLYVHHMADSHYLGLTSIRVYSHRSSVAVVSVVSVAVVSVVFLL